MEENQNQGQQNQSLFQLNLDEQTGYTLRSATSWAKVLAIVGFICAGLIVIMAIVVQSKLGSYRSSRYYDDDFSGSTRTLSTMIIVVYFIIAIIQFLSSLFMWQFGNKISTAFKANDQAALNAGFAGLRNYIALWAILLIIGLLFMLISLAAGASSM